MEEIICEIRFPSVLSFFDRKIKMGEKFREKLPHWELDPFYIKLFSKIEKGKNTQEKKISPKKILIIESKRASLTYHIENIFQNFKADAIYFFPEIIKFLEIEKLIRMGLRIRYLFPLKKGNFEELKDLLFKRLYQKIPLENITDIAYIINFKEDDYSFHVELGPLRQREIKDRFPFEGSLPNVSMLIDIDCFQLDLDGKNVNIDESFHHIENVKNKIMEKIG